MSELSKDTLSEQATLDWPGPMSGLFLYVLDERPIVGGITVLASVACPDAAFQLFEIIAAKFTSAKSNKQSARARSRSRKAVDISDAYL